MSSKLLRAGDSPAASAVRWHPGPAGAPQRPGACDTPAPEAEDKEALETRIAAAHQQGRSEAEAAANQRALQRAEPVIAALNRIVQELVGTRKSFRAEAEQDTVKLAIAIARRLLHRELSTD